MAHTIEGSRIAHAFELAAAVGKEVSALVQTLDDLIDERIQASCVTYEFFDSAEESSLTDDEEWVCMGWAKSFPLITRKKGPGKRKSYPDMYLAYQISLSGPGTLGGDNPEPLLHVLCLESAVDFAEDHYVGGALLKDYPWVLEGESLIRWLTEEDNATETGEWAFSLRLTSLNSSQDLEEKIVNPAIALLNGKSSQEALPSTLGGLVRFRKEAERLVIT